MFRKRETGQDELLPLIDIFLNPGRFNSPFLLPVGYVLHRHYEKEQMEGIMRNLTLSFFSSSDMALIYPNLFRLLWWLFA